MAGLSGLLESVPEWRGLSVARSVADCAGGDLLAPARAAPRPSNFPPSDQTTDHPVAGLPAGRPKVSTGSDKRQVAAPGADALLRLPLVAARA